MQAHAYHTIATGKAFRVESRQMKMKRILLSCLVLAVCLCGTTRVRAAEDPGDKFLEAYFLIQDGDSAEHNSDWVKATTKFNAAHEILDQIKTQNPEWNPHIIEFRTKYVEEHLAALQPKVGTPAAPEMLASKPEAPAIGPSSIALPIPAEAVTGTVQSAWAQPVSSTTNAPVRCSVAKVITMPAAPTPAENEQVKQLTAELERARQQVQQLQVARDELNAKLQEQLGKVAPTQTNQQIEDLLKTNQVLAAQLAAAQTEAAEARDRAAHVPPPVPTPAPTPPAVSPELAQLRTELSQTRGELQQTKEELQQTRVELDTTKESLAKSQADNAELRHSYDAVIAQLRTPTSDFTSAKASGDKDDEIIRQLRKEHASCGSLPSAKPPRHLSAGKAEKAPMGRRFPSFAAGVLINAPRRRPRNNPNRKQRRLPPPWKNLAGANWVATLTSPKKAETPPAPAAVPPANTQTNTPSKPVVTVKKTPPPTPALTSTNAPGPVLPSRRRRQRPNRHRHPSRLRTGANTRARANSYECTGTCRSTQTGTQADAGASARTDFDEHAGTEQLQTHRHRRQHRYRRRHPHRFRQPQSHRRLHRFRQ